MQNESKTSAYLTPYLVQKGKNYADFCDRCGAEIGGAVEQYPAYWTSNVGCHQTRRIGIGIIMKGKRYPLDLCDMCARDLTAWMQNVNHPANT